MSEETTAEMAEEGGQVEDIETSEVEDAEDQDIGEESEESSNSDGEETTDPESKGKGINKRFKKLSTKAKEQEERAIAAEQQAEYWKRQATGAPMPEPDLPQKPKFEDFGYDDAAFSDALEQWQQKASQIKAQHEQQQQRERDLQAEQSRITASFKVKADNYAEEVEDFQAVATNPNLPVSQEAFLGIQVADNGPQVLYHLGKNLELAKSINAMPPVRQLMEIGKLSAELAKPPPKPKVEENTPDPIKPISNKSASRKPTSKMSDAEYSEYRRRRKAAKGLT